MDIFIDLNFFVDGKIFLFQLFLKVVPLGFDALVELFSLFQDSYLEHVESSAVFDDQLKVIIYLFGVVVLPLFEFVHDGVKVHGVFDFIVVTGDKCAIDGLLEDL